MPSQSSIARHFLRGITALSIAAGFAACSAIKASPTAETTTFLTHQADLKPMPERFPFQKVWVSEKLKGLTQRHYTKIYFSEVETSHLQANTESWKMRYRDVGAHPEDVEDLARYMREKFVEAMKRYPGATVEVLESDPGTPDTVRIELAITELVPSATAQRAAATTAGLFVPGAGLAAAGSSGSIAFEARVRDSASEEVLAEFADREKDKSAPIDLAGLKWYSRSKENVDDWAKQLAELANTPPDHQVKDSLPFTLRPF